MGDVMNTALVFFYLSIFKLSQTGFPGQLHFFLKIPSTTTTSRKRAALCATAIPRCILGNGLKREELCLFGCWTVNSNRPCRRFFSENPQTTSRQFSENPQTTSRLSENSENPGIHCVRPGGS